jgi:hypothetical protein
LGIRRCGELNRLDNHIRAHRGEWLVFLHDPEAPPTNNHTERMLRPPVITRKVGGCNRTIASPRRGSRCVGRLDDDGRPVIFRGGRELSGCAKECPDDRIGG